MHAWIADGTGGHHPASTLNHHDRDHDDIHLFHCFDYLRQAIMCHGDTALEGADPYLVAEGIDLFEFGTFGISTTHMCKSYDAVREWAVARKIREENL